MKSEEFRSHPWTRRSVLGAGASLGLMATLAPQSASAESFSLKLGSAVALSGDLASLGKTDDAAARLAAKYFQDSAKKAGLEAAIEVFTEDTQSKPASAAEAVAKLVKSDGAQVIVGPASTGETIPAFQATCLPSGIPMMTLASSPAVSTVDGAGRLLFRTTPSDKLQAAYLVKLAQSKLGASSTINVGALNNAPGNAFSTIVVEAWKAGGGKVADPVKWNADQTTFDTEAQKLADGSPDGWIIYDYPGSWQKFLPALVRTGKWDPNRTFGGDPIADVSSDLGAKMVGVKMLNIGSKPGKNSDDFERMWKESVGLNFVYGEPQTFDAAIILFLAALKAKSADGQAIAAQIRAVSGPNGTKFDWQQLPDAISALLNGQDIHYVGATGEFDFNETGDVSSAYYTILEWTPEGKKATGSVGG